MVFVCLCFLFCFLLRSLLTVKQEIPIYICERRRVLIALLISFVSFDYLRYTCIYSKHERVVSVLSLFTRSVMDSRNLAWMRDDQCIICVHCIHSSCHQWNTISRATLFLFSFFFTLCLSKLAGVVYYKNRYRKFEAHAGRSNIREREPHFYNNLSNILNEWKKFIWNVAQSILLK